MNNITRVGKVTRVSRLNAKTARRLLSCWIRVFKRNKYSTDLIHRSFCLLILFLNLKIKEPSLLKAHKETVHKHIKYLETDLFYLLLINRIICDI